MQGIAGEEVGGFSTDGRVREIPMRRRLARLAVVLDVHPALQPQFTQTRAPAAHAADLRQFRDADPLTRP